MTKESPAPLKVKGINQLAIAVWDLEPVVRNYWNLLGIGPWTIYDWESPLVYDRTYRGKKAWARERIALAQVGKVQLELVQPVEGPSIYRDWLEKHGESLHHMNFLVDDVDEAVAILGNQGFPSIQSGRFLPKELKGAYNYVETPPLHTIWEPVHVGERLDGVPTMYPATEQESPARIKVKGINQVAIAVWDLECTAEDYWNILGIGPWQIYNWEAPLVYDRTYQGKPAWAKERIALAQVGDVQLELVQPVEGPSVYRDWIEKHGEGLHHMNFLVDDVDEAAAILAEEGFESMQSGKFGPREQKGAFNYIDIWPLHAIWEPVHVGEEIGAEPIIFP